MRLLVIGTRFAPIPAIDGGAIEKLAQDYLEHNSKTQKHSIVVYSSYSPKVTDIKAKYNNVEFRYIKKSNAKYKVYRLFCGIARKLLKNKVGDEFARSVVDDLNERKELSHYDKVIILNNINNITYLTNKVKGKHILHLHNDYLNKETKNACKILKSLDEVWCVSEFIKKQVDTICENKKTKVLYNGTEIEKFNKTVSDTKIKNLRGKYNITNDTFVVLFTGRIMREKGVQELINSYTKSFEGIKSKLLIVGSPNDSNKSFYKKLINEYKDNENIIFLGTKTHKEINELYKISNVQVVPSMWNEAFGLTVIEGMSAGIPLIVSNSGGIPEIVKDNSAIIVTREKIESELEIALKKIYNLDDSNISKMINNAQKRVKDFTVEKYCENIDKLLEKE